MRHLFDIPLGASYAPIGFKHGDGIDWGAIAAIGGSALIGAIASTANTNSINNTNYENVRETNTQNALMHQADLAWAKQQYEDQKSENRFLVDQAYQRQNDLVADERAYTDPAAVKQRYLNAGINPYLASQAGVASGSSGSQSVQSGSAPSSNMPSSPEMKAAQAIPSNAFGQGISDAFSRWMQSRQEERSDYALASDIQTSHMNAFSNFMNACTKAKEAGVNEKFINDTMNRAWREIQFNENKFEKDTDLRTQELALQDRAVEVQEMQVKIAGYLAKSNVAMNAVQIQNIAQSISESRQRVFEMAQDGASKRSIDKYIERQQKATASQLERQNAREGRQDVEGGRRWYRDFTDWLFTPLKGIVSIK